MRIDEELYKIATANYGVDLREPIFVAFDKFSNDKKFELLDNFINDDYAELDTVMSTYFNNKTTSRILRSIMDMFMIINGRKGFYCKQFVGHQPDPEDNLSLWMGMLANELRNSGNGNVVEGISVRGNGIVNGSKVRRAIYHMLEILNHGTPYSVEDPVYTTQSPYCILGRDIHWIEVWGNEDGVGYLNPNDNKYYVDVEITDLYKKDSPTKTITIEIGDEPLYGVHAVEYDCSGMKFPYSLYDIKVKDFKTDITVSYNILRDSSLPDTDDYVYELYGQADIYTKIHFYIGKDTEVLMPEHFEHEYNTVTTINPCAFTYTDVERIYIPEGVTSID